MMASERNQQLFNPLYRRYASFDCQQLEEEMEKTTKALKKAKNKEFRKVATISALAIFTNQIQLYLPISQCNIDEIFQYFCKSPCYQYIDIIQ
tara:strand:- start:969 stop:1247 length:279 start_codon:yes stop_codon:yes gene_type:complete